MTKTRGSTALIVLRSDQDITDLPFEDVVNMDLILRVEGEEGDKRWRVLKDRFGPEGQIVVGEEALGAMISNIANLPASVQSPGGVESAYHTLLDCERAIEDAHPETRRWLMLGTHQEGDKVTCPDPECGREFVHICDEAEGCSWVPV